MTTHNLKVWPTYFQAIVEGIKKFEIRKNDRNFAVGDVLVLQEYDPIEQAYVTDDTDAESGFINTVCVKVTYIAQGVFGLGPDTCVMSIETF